MKVNDIVYEALVNLDVEQSIGKYGAAVTWIIPCEIIGYSKKKDKYFVFDDEINNSLVFIDNFNKPYGESGRYYYPTRETARKAAEDYILSQIIWRDEEGAEHE